MCLVWSFHANFQKLAGEKCVFNLFKDEISIDYCQYNLILFSIACFILKFVVHLKNNARKISFFAVFYSLLYELKRCLS